MTERSIEERLAAIESLLQRLPEIQAAVFIDMWEQYQRARLSGQSPRELWEIIPPDQR